MFCLRLFILPLLIALAFQTACDFTAVEVATAVVETARGNTDIEGFIDPDVAAAAGGAVAVAAG